MLTLKSLKFLAIRFSDKVSEFRNILIGSLTIWTVSVHTKRNGKMQANLKPYSLLTTIKWASLKQITQPNTACGNKHL